MKKFIITDPCYIMDRSQYRQICDEGCDFEGQEFPLESTHCENGNKIIFHLIEVTPNGDGGLTFRGQEINVDAGLLCIAECENGWEEETCGAKFKSLKVAENNFSAILNRF